MKTKIKSLTIATILIVFSIITLFSSMAVVRTFTKENVQTATKQIQDYKNHTLYTEAEVGLERHCVDSAQDSSYFSSIFRMDTIDTSNFRTINRAPETGTRSILIILWTPNIPGIVIPDKDAIENLFFGDRPSLRDYYLENSDNQLEIVNAGVLGWYNADNPPDYYYNRGPRGGPYDQEDLPEDRNGNGRMDAGEDLNNNGRLDGPDEILQLDEDINHNGRLDYDLNGDGWIGGYTEIRTEAILKAAREFDFRAYDSNGNGIIENNELGIVILMPSRDPSGFPRGVFSREYPQQVFRVDGVTVPYALDLYIGTPPSLGLSAHEVSHLLLDLRDIYFAGFPGFYPYAAGAYSIMDMPSYAPNHLDPFNKILLGWIEPTVITPENGINRWHSIRDIETHYDAYILSDPSRVGEYFIIENRWPGDSYDRLLPDSGLGIWHIIEDTSILRKMPAPRGVSPSFWATLDTWGEARKVIRMIRPKITPPFDDHKALWDGSEPETGYNLLSVDPNPNHPVLQWADGTLSGFSIKNISSSGPVMRFYVQYDRPPLPPTGLRAEIVSATRVNLAWTASPDAARRVVEYKIYRNGTLVNTVVTTSYIDRTSVGLSPVNYSVSGYNPATRLESERVGIVVSSPANLIPITPPSPPTGLRAEIVSAAQVNLAWTASPDAARRRIMYKVYRDGNFIAFSSRTDYLDRLDTPLTSSTVKRYAVSASSADGRNESGRSNEALVSYDRTPPSRPSLSIAGIQSRSLVLDILFLGDESGGTGVQKYKIYRNGIATNEGPMNRQGGNTWIGRFTDRGLNPSTAYEYSVTILDGAGNESEPSTLRVTMLAMDDFTAPSVPTGITIRRVGDGARAILRWNPSIDNPGGSGMGLYGWYTIQERSTEGLSRVAILGTYFTIVNPSSDRYYSVSAADIDRNESAFSEEVSLTAL